MCPIGFLMLGSPCKTCRAIRPPHADQPAAEGELAAHRVPPTNDPRVHPAYPGRPRGRAGHRPNHLPRRRPSPNRRLGGPAPPAPASSMRLRLRQTTSRAWTQRATTPTRPSQPSGCLPHRRAPGPHFGRTQRTRQRTNTGRPHRTPDSGRRTVDTWTLRRPHRTLDIGLVDRQAWTLVARTGHRTLAEAEAVKPGETPGGHLVCMSASGVGWLIQATAGSLGGVGGRANRCGLVA
jgi:hypothetical protein